MNKKMRISLIGLVATLSLVAAACGDDDDTASAAGDSSEQTSADASAGGGMTLAEGPVGPACSSIPEEGEGSFSGMADDPAATAASNNPELSTLVTAVGEAGLGDTLNGEGPFTIFAPANSAFAQIPEEDLNAVLADKDLLTSILTLHVVPGEILDGATLASMDSVATVNGQDITIAPAGDSLEINGQAQVVCANIEVGNGVVHIIDTVMMP